MSFGNIDVPPISCDLKVAVTRSRPTLRCDHALNVTRRVSKNFSTLTCVFLIDIKSDGLASPSICAGRRRFATQVGDQVGMRALVELNQKMIGTVLKSDNRRSEHEIRLAADLAGFHQYCAIE